MWGENDGELVAAFAEDAGVTDLDEWFVLQVRAICMKYRRCLW